MDKRIIDIIEKINKPGSVLTDDDYEFIMSDKNHILYLTTLVMEAAINIEIILAVTRKNMPKISERLNDMPLILRTIACLLKEIVNKNEFFDKKI